MFLVFQSPYDLKVVMQNSRIPLAGVALWFGLMVLSYRTFPTGWQAPWDYADWFSCLASWIVWGFCVLFTVALVDDFLSQNIKPVLGTEPGEYGSILGMGLIPLALSGGLSYLHTQDRPFDMPVADHREDRSLTAREAGPVSHEQMLCFRLGQLREQHSRLSTAVISCQAHRRFILDALQNDRVMSGSGLPRIPEHQVLAHELLKIQQTLKAIEERQKAVLLTIVKGESLLRQIGCQRDLKYAGMGAADLDEFVRWRIGIDELLQSDGLVFPTHDGTEFDEVPTATRF